MKVIMCQYFFHKNEEVIVFYTYFFFNDWFQFQKSSSRNTDYGTVTILI